MTIAPATQPSIPLLDLSGQYQAIAADVSAAIERVVRSQQFILGPEVDQLEREIATYSTCQFGIGVSPGTDALLVSLMALGIGGGDEVITTPYTFFATVGCISRVGAKPVFVDVVIRVDERKRDGLMSHLKSHKSAVKSIIRCCSI